MTKKISCSGCLKDLPATSEYFYRHRNSRTGFQCYCKKCKSQKQKESYIKKAKPEYALYRGEECLVIGTAEEIAKDQGIAISSVYYYGTPAHKKRIKGNAKVLVKLDE